MRSIFLIFSFCLISVSRAEWSAGPLYDEFPLTLESGTRREAVGPFFYLEQKETQHTLGLPPLFSCVRDADLDFTEVDFVYPVLTYDRYGSEYRFQILQLFSFAGGQTQDENHKRRFTLFPVYFQQRSEIPKFNYTALFPIYGTLKNRLFRDEIHFVAFPIYSTTRRKDVVTDNYVYPFFHLRRGDGLRGWQVWPLVGFEHKKITNRTNHWGDVEVVGGHEKFFALWPIYFNNTLGIGTTNEQKQLSILPLFTSLRSPLRDSLTAPWPIGVSITEDRVRKYREVGAPWPFIVFARGQGKTTSRVWPLFSRAATTNMESSFYFWPIYKHNAFRSPPLERERTRILFFLYSDIVERNLEADEAKRRIDVWPLFTFRRDFEGRQRLQVLSILEPLLPNSEAVERNYSPIWSIWRSEKNPKTDASSRSFLWNLYRCDRLKEVKKRSLLFGLFQYESAPGGNSMKLFYLPLGTAKDENSETINAHR